MSEYLKETYMIADELDYCAYIQEQGVGANDKVASSLKSYVSYLNSVSRLLDKKIDSNLIRSENDIEKILYSLKGKRASNTLINYKSALNQYLKFLKNEKKI